MKHITQNSTFLFTISCLSMMALVVATQSVTESDKTQFNPSAQLVKPESQEDDHADDKRSSISRNPYSWLNEDKRSSISRNPYSWMSNFYDSGNANPYPYYGRYMSKKSTKPQFVWMSDYKRTRNPYSWMNFDEN